VHAGHIEISLLSPSVPRERFFNEQGCNQAAFVPGIPYKQTPFSKRAVQVPSEALWSGRKGTRWSGSCGQLGEPGEGPGGRVIPFQWDKTEHPSSTGRGDFFLYFYFFLGVFFPCWFGDELEVSLTSHLRPEMIRYNWIPFFSDSSPLPLRSSQLMRAPWRPLAFWVNWSKSPPEGGNLYWGEAEGRREAFQPGAGSGEQGLSLGGCRLGSRRRTERGVPRAEAAGGHGWRGPGDGSGAAPLPSSACFETRLLLRFALSGGLLRRPRRQQKRPANAVARRNVQSPGPRQRRLETTQLQTSRPPSKSASHRPTQTPAPHILRRLGLQKGNLKQNPRAARCQHRALREAAAVAWPRWAEDKHPRLGWSHTCLCTSRGKHFQSPKIFFEAYMAFLTELQHLPNGAALSWQAKIREFPRRIPPGIPPQAGRTLRSRHGLGGARWRPAPISERRGHPFLLPERVKAAGGAFRSGFFARPHARRHGEHLLACVPGVEGAWGSLGARSRRVHACGCVEIKPCTHPARTSHARSPHAHRTLAVGACMGHTSVGHIGQGVRTLQG